MTNRIVGALLLASIAATARADSVTIRISQLAFGPQQIAVHVGDTIQWVNADFVAHTATARNGAFDVTLAPNATKSVVLSAAGTFDYYCRFHPNMTGRITVAK
jgi:plastocyanin